MKTNCIYIALALLIIVYSCKSKESLISPKEDWMTAYKKVVLYGCLNGATENNFSKFSRANNDLGIATEVAVLYHAEAKLAENIGEKLSKKIRAINYSDYQGKKPVFSDCVDIAYGKYVDSVARIQYRRVRNGKLEYIEN